MKKYGAGLFQLVFALLFLIACGDNTNATSLEPCRGEPPRIIITHTEDIQKLENFEPVYPPINNEINGGGGGQAIFRVKASPQIVWDVIADFPNYPTYNSDVSEASYYKPRLGDITFVKFVAGPWLYQVTWHVKHNYPMLKTGWGTWELDKTKTNDLTDCIGFWRVDALPNNPNFSEVSYSVNLEADGLVLNILKPMLISSGVQKATQWIKKEAEHRAGTDN